METRHLKENTIPHMDITQIEQLKKCKFWQLFLKPNNIEKKPKSNYEVKNWKENEMTV